MVDRTKLFSAQAVTGQETGIGDAQDVHGPSGEWG